MYVHAQLAKASKIIGRVTRVPIIDKESMSLLGWYYYVILKEMSLLCGQCAMATVYTKWDRREHYAYQVGLIMSLCGITTHALKHVNAITAGSG